MKSPAVKKTQQKRCGLAVSAVGSGHGELESAQTSETH